MRIIYTLLICGAAAACAPTRPTLADPPSPTRSDDPPPPTQPVLKPPDRPSEGVLLPPTVSRSEGQAGGVVLLWPRIIPRSQTAALRPLAARVQARLRAIVEATLPGRPIDARPEPERVCPQGGCKGVAAGVLLVTSGRSCVAVALIRAPGRGPTTLLPWAGRVRLKQATVPFRSPPESAIVINDFESCEALAGRLDATEPVKAALKRAGGR